jgi:hypothetical protein
MPNEKEIQRLVGIAREHARTAIAKPEVQRESFLGFCRLNWKRYAAGIARSTAEGERFANAMDRATRDLMALMQDPANAQRVEALSPWHPLSDAAVEGGMESVTVFEAAIEPAPIPEPEPGVPESEKSALARAEEEYLQSQPRLGTAEAAPLPSPAEEAAAQVAEEEDRQSARFGFSGLEPREKSAPAPTPPADPELKRKVQDLLRAHALAKAEEERKD